jgi:hypothetical protein
MYRAKRVRGTFRIAGSEVTAVTNPGH